MKKEPAIIIVSLLLGVALDEYGILPWWVSNIGILAAASILLWRFWSIWGKIYFAIALQFTLSESLNLFIPTKFYANDLFAIILAFVTCYHLFRTIEQWKS